MELKDLLAILWKRRLVVMLMVILTGLLSLAFASSQPERYESTSTIALTPNVEQGATFLAPDTLDALLGTYAQTAKSRLTLDRAERALGRPLPGEVDTSTEPGTGILRIVGRAEDPDAAAETAEAVSDAFLESIAGSTLLNSEVVDPAMPAASPVQPRPPLIVGVGLLLGLIGGAMVAYVVEQLRRRIESTADVAEITPAPVLGRLPRHRGLGRSESSIIWEGSHLTALQEGFRALRTNVELLAPGAPVALQVTSPVPQQGKSTVVANLGVALSQVGVETIIVDADLRRPAQHQIFGVDNSVGLSTLMAIPDSPIETVPTRYPHLSLLPSGPPPPNSTEMLHVRFPSVLSMLKELDAVLLIDSPPLLPVSDARLISSGVDHVLLVVAAGSQKPSMLRSAIEKLEFAGASLLGVVLNFSGEESEQGAYDYYRAHDEPELKPARRTTLTP